MLFGRSMSATLFKVFLLGVGGGAVALLATSRKRVGTLTVLGANDTLTTTVPPAATDEFDTSYDALPSDAVLDQTIGQDIDPEVGAFRIGSFDVDAREVAGAADGMIEDNEEMQDIGLDEIQVGLGDPPLMTTITEMPEGLTGTGELYGAVMPQAVDRDLSAEEDQAYQHAEDGENWIEALSTSATEFGAEPEHVLDMSDEGLQDEAEDEELDEDDDRPRHALNADEPVADKGSAGTSGL